VLPQFSPIITSQSQNPHKLQQSLLKFLMYLFDSSADFQLVDSQLDFLERLVAIIFPNGSLSISSGEETVKVWSRTLPVSYPFALLVACCICYCCVRLFDCYVYV
jgi:hypothetical protein